MNKITVMTGTLAAILCLIAYLIEGDPLWILAAALSGLSVALIWRPGG